jgi:N utilization substance protein B
VTIDEAVEIARSFGTEDSYRFVNGVLDAVRKRGLVPGGPR